MIKGKVYRDDGAPRYFNYDSVKKVLVLTTDLGLRANSGDGEMDCIMTMTEYYLDEDADLEIGIQDARKLLGMGIKTYCTIDDL